MKQHHSLGGKAKPLVAAYLGQQAEAYLWKEKDLFPEEEEEREDEEREEERRREKARKERTLLMEAQEVHDRRAAEGMSNLYTNTITLPNELLHYRCKEN